MGKKNEQFSRQRKLDISDFYFETDIAPRGISYDELMRTCLIAFSNPSEFTFSMSNTTNLSYYEQFSEYLKFCEEHPNIEVFQTILFPLFCYIIMKLKDEDDINGIAMFKKSFLKKIPSKYEKEVKEFMDFENGNDEKFKYLSSLLITQKFIVEMKNSEVKILNEFINNENNYQLRILITEIIIIDLILNERDIKETFFNFKMDDGMKALNVLKTKIDDSSIVCISNNVVYAVNEDKYIIKIEKNKYENIYNHPSVITSMCLSSENKILLSTDIEGNAILHSDYATGKLSYSFIPVWCSKFAPYGGVFALGYDDCFIKLFDANTLNIHRELVGHTGPILEVEFHPNCSLLGSISQDPSIRVWDLREASSVRLFIGKQNQNSNLAFSWNGQFLAYHDGNFIKIKDIGSGKTFIKKQFQMNVSYITFSSDSQSLYIVTNGGLIYCFSFANPKTNQYIFEIHNLREKVVFCDFNLENTLRIVTSN